MLLILMVFGPGQPRGEPIDRRLVLGVLVDEIGQLLGQPAERDILSTAPRGEFLDAAVGEVHGASLASGGPIRLGPRARPLATWPSPVRPPGARAARSRRGRGRALPAGAWPYTARHPC